MLCRRLLSSICLLISATVLSAANTFDAFGYKWQVASASDWKLEMESGLPVLHLVTPRPSLAPRRPSQYALALTPDYEEVTLELEVRKESRQQRSRRTSVILVYAWRDENHFNYAHLSVDAASEQPVHNGIFHVYGGDRVRISSEEGAAALNSEDWHKVRLRYEANKGRVDVYVNGQSSPSLRAVDWSLGAGKVGVGSFFDMGAFRSIRIDGRVSR